MYLKTSQRYKDTIYNSSVQSVVNIYIDGVLLNPKYLTDFKMGCELFNDNFELGSTPSQYIEMQIHKKSGIVNPKTIRIEYGILVNNALTVAEVNKMLICDLNKLQVKSLSKNDNSFEMIPIGTYNVDDYNDEDDNVINIKALDNIIKLDKDDGYYDASELINQKGYATLGEIAQDICTKKGLELETSSFINSDNKISVYDNQLSAREYMSYIAEKAGCFCCASRYGKIQFRQIGQDTVEIPLKLFKTYKFGEEYKISRVAFEDGVRSFKFGNETRNTLWIRQDNLFVTAETEVQNIYNKIKDLTINSFEGTVIIDPCVDIGDKIIIDGKSIIYQGEMTLNKRFIADINSKISIKQKEETTVKKESQTVINRRVQSRIDEAEGKITQLVEENTETSNKLSEHTQTIDSMKDTLKSQETKIETVESKADNAQNTADSATTKANNAQTAANTANTNAQNAQNTANANTTKITTNTTKIAEVEKTVDGITQSVSAVEEKVETVESTANTAKTTADTANTTANTAKTTADKVNNDLTTKYYTKTETENKLTQTAESTISEVSKTYSTKTETATAKTEAINSANSSTDNKLKDYTVINKLGTWVEQNYEYIKYAWNQISQYLKMEGIDGKATLNIYDENNKMLMSLNQNGEYFYKDDAKIGSIGVIRNSDGKDELIIGAELIDRDSGGVESNSIISFGSFDSDGNFFEAFKIEGIYGYTDHKWTSYISTKQLEATILTALQEIIVKSSIVFGASLESGDGTGQIYTEPISSSKNCIVLDATDGVKIKTNIFTGYTVIGINTEHKYFLNWTGSQLQFFVDGQNVGTLSDKRLKTDIKDIDEDFIKAIEEVEMKQFKVANRNGLISFGILAQDLIGIFEKYNKNLLDYEIVQETLYKTDDDTIYYTINYEQFLILKQKATDKKLEELQEKDRKKDEIITDLIRRIEILESKNIDDCSK